MRKKNMLLFLMLGTALMGQKFNVDRGGQWAEGRCEAVFRRGQYTFVGNGSYLQVYRRGEFGSFDFYLETLLPAVIRDIWVVSDLKKVYAACGTRGLVILELDTLSDKLTLVREVVTQGFATGVGHNYRHVYVATNSRGLAIVNIADPLNAYIEGRYIPSKPVRDVWTVNDTLSLLAVDESGLFAISSRVKNQPIFLDSIDFNPAFLGYTIPDPQAKNVMAVGNIAYVATGYGGMRIVNFQNPSSLQSLGTWTDTMPIDVLEVRLKSNTVFLACGEDGLIGPIDVSDPANPGTQSFPALNSPGVTNRLWISGDSAYVCDGPRGFLIVNVKEGFQSSLVRTIPTSDYAHDIAVDNDYAYLAAGRAGLKIFSLSFSPSKIDHLNLLGKYDTAGEVYGVVVRDNYAFLANGSAGLKVVDVITPAAPINVGQFTNISDRCYDADVYSEGGSSYALLACGLDGMIVVDNSGFFKVQQINTVGSSKGVLVHDNRAFLADSSGAYVYNIVDLPALPQQTHSLISNMEALDLAVVGDTLFVANGRYGFLVWNLETNGVQRIQTGGMITGIRVHEKSIYLTDSQSGLRVFDFSSPGLFPEIGYYRTSGEAQAADVSAARGFIAMADGSDGLYLFRSAIQPDISFYPESPLEFGPVPAGRSRLRMVNFINSGTTMLNVEDINWTSALFSISPTSFEVAPGDTHQIKVTFAPTAGMAVQTLSDIASVVSNDPDSPVLEFTMQGRIASLVTEGPYSKDEFTVGLYHMDDTNITATVRDTSVYKKHAVVHGEPSQVNSQTGYNKAISLDGESDYCVIPYHNHLNFNNSPFTLELWFNIAKMPETFAVLLRRGDAGTRQVELALDNQSDKGLMASVWDPNGDQYILYSGSISIFNIGQWYHAAFTWDMDSLRLYLNGDQVDQKKMIHTLRPQSTDPMIIGATSSGYLPFNGQIDEVHLSNIARHSWEFHVNRAKISVHPSIIEFGNVLVGKSRSVPVTIYNRGSQQLNITGMSTNISAVKVESDLPLSINPGSSIKIWMKYSPQTEFNHADSRLLVIMSTDPTYPTYSVPMMGKAISTFRAGPYVSDPFTLGLYHFDDNGSSVATDSSGRGLDGLFRGSVIYDPLIRKFDEGYSVKFKKTTERIIVHPNSDDILSPAWGGFSLEVWFLIDRFPVTQSVIMRRGNVAANQFDLYVDNSGRIVGRMYNRAQAFTEVSSSGIEPVQLNQWYHVAMVQNEDELLLYVNGDSVQSQPFSGIVASDQSQAILDTLSLLIGGDWKDVNAFSGNLDEIRISGVGRQLWEFNVNMARISITPPQLDFGEVFLGSDRTLEIVVDNNMGIDTLTVDSISIDLDTYYHANMNGFILIPDETRRMRVTYTAVAPGSHSGKMVFYTNDPFWPEKTLNLYGKTIEWISQVAYRTDPFTLSLFHLDEIGDDGKTLADSSGNRINGKLSGNVTYSDTGRFGGGLRFNGGYFEIPARAITGKIHSYFTIETWFQFSTMPDSGALIVQRIDDQQNRQFDITASTGENGQMIARIWNQYNQGFTLHGMNFNDMNPMQWYHVGLSIDGTWARFFMNGIVQDSIAFTDNILNLTGGSIRFGLDIENERKFIGFMDEIRISNIDRKPEELNVMHPQITLSVYQLFFDEVKLGFSRIMKVRISNQGDQDLQILQILGPDTVFSIPDTMKTLTLNRLESVYLPVTFKPVVANKIYSYTWTIKSNAENSPQINLSLSGSGYMNPGVSEYLTDGYTLALYHFNQSHGDTLFDTSGNDYHGFLWNGARISYDEAYFTASVRFDGNNDRIEIPARDAFQNNLRSQNLTLECYFKTDTVSQVLIGKGYQDSLMHGDIVVAINGQGRITVNGIDGVGPRVNDDAWHHLAFMYNSQSRTGSVFVDWNLIWSVPWDVSLPMADIVRPIILGSAEKKDGGYSGYFMGFLDEFRFSTIDREIWNFNAPVDAGIMISSLTPAHPSEGDPVTLSIEMPPTISAAHVSLFYREAGLKEYESDDAFPESDSVFNAIIPAGKVTLRGLEYYVKVVTSTQQVFTLPFMDPSNNPLCITIRFESMPAKLNFFAQRTETGRYQLATLISVPFKLDAVSADTIFVGIPISKYDPFQWRLFWWDPNRSQAWYNFDPNGIIYVEYSEIEKEYFLFPPGRAYWLVSDLDRKFTLRSGETVVTDTSFQKELKPGWNMIGNPYNFTIRWSDCSVSSNNVIPAYGWEGEDGYRPDTPLLEPWKGYWLYNSGMESAFLYINPKAAPLVKNSPLSRTLLADLEENSWLFQLSAKNEYGCDLYNFAGVRESALPGYDLYDRPEPPAGFANSVSLMFDHAEWEKQAGSYAADIRPPDSDGQVWEFSVRYAEDKKPVTLTWQRFQETPEPWKVFLLDMEDEMSVDMLQYSMHAFQADDPAGSRKFKLIAGTEEFLEANHEGISLKPVEFALFPNAPNPFNPSTTIHFGLPRKSDVEITIYNALGQRIRQITQPDCHAGYHRIVWDATSNDGTRQASGIYICRLKAAGRSAVQKMVLVK